MANKKNLKQNRKGKAEPKEQALTPLPTLEPADFDPHNDLPEAGDEPAEVAPIWDGLNPPMPDDPPPPSHDTIHIGAGLGAVHVEADFGAGDADGDPIVIADTLLRQSLEADPDPTPDPAPDPLLDAMRRDGIVADPLVLPPPRQTYDEWMMTNLAPVRPFHRWDDTRLMVADIEKHARLSHGLTPDTDMLKRIADYIRESFGVTEADVPKP